MGLITREEAEAAAVASAGNRYALLICNGTFEHIQDYQLPGPAKDAEQMQAVLSDAESCRFEVTTLLDKGLLDVRREIARMASRATSADTLLIYYSGNGIKGDNGELYLLLADADSEFPSATTLDAEFILAQLRASSCRRIILVIDACYAGAFFHHNRGIPSGLYAMTSCSDDEETADTPDGGAFSLAICEGLRNAAADADGDGYVTVDELHEFVKESLKNERNGGTPQKWVWNVPERVYLTTVPKHVFVSYAHEDMSTADWLSTGLQRKGLPVWFDRKGVRSGNWKDRVTSGMSQARVVILIMTPTGLGSDPVRKELGLAAAKGVPIIPIQPNELGRTEIPDWFTLDYGELHRYVIAEDDRDRSLDDLVGAIRELGRDTARKRASEPREVITR